MPEKKKKITIKEVKEIEPKADVYELNPYCKYLIMVRKSELVGGYELAHKKAQVIMNVMTSLEIQCAILIGMNDDVKIMELS